MGELELDFFLQQSNSKGRAQYFSILKNQQGKSLQRRIFSLRVKQGFLIG